MTITVTTQPSNSPPRNQIVITSPDGSPITAVSLVRADPGGTVTTRVQPPTGPSPITVYDYEAPWDAAITYTAAITYASGATASYSSGFLTLSPAFPWLTHPTTPALSVCLDQGRFDSMGVASIGGVIRQALTTKHRIQGSEYQIVTRTGPRAAPATSLQVRTVTSAERAALIALIRDQTPLLVQIPAAWGWDWENGYYDVGDVNAERVLQYGPEPGRTVTLPLERVEAPIGTQLPAWTWTGVLAGSATWDAAKAAYATWGDLLSNTRR